MKSSNKKKRHPRRLKDALLRSFLIISIICCVFLVSNCDQLFDLFGPGHGNGGGTTNPPGLGGTENTNYAAKLLTSVAEGAAGEIGGSTVSWAMSAIGLSDNSGSDYGKQLKLISDDLSVIINQLQDMITYLDKIDGDINKLNCSTWQGHLTGDISFIITDTKAYRDLLIDASDTTQRVTDSAASDWVDKALAQGKYLSSPNYKPMNLILSDFEANMIVSSTDGLIPSCVQAIDYTPVEHSFATDTVYYDQVKTLTDYYYYYQVEALFLYSEAEHYLSWVAAGRPSASDTTGYKLTADQVYDVCNVARAPCNSVVDETNTLYNSLVSQFTLAGAPYTNTDTLVAEYRREDSGSLLWPLSLEDFTKAAGDDTCSNTLTSGNPCGTTAGFYDQHNLGGVTYKGYSGWSIAGSAALAQLLDGWTSGKAGSYLQSKLGFKNMTNKVIISADVLQISLNESGDDQEVIPFVDTDFDYNWFSNVPGEPVANSFQFQAGTLVKTRTKSGPCNTKGDDYVEVTYKTNPNMPSNRNGFYNANSYAKFCGSGYLTPLSFSTKPGWLAQQGGTVNHENSARQFRWPVLFIGNIKCTGNRQNKNIGGMWTMCGNDFVNYLNNYVPEPTTCSDTNYPCSPPAN